MLSGAVTHDGWVAGGSPAKHSRRPAMQVESISIQLASENREKLVAFYRDVVQLPVDDTMGEIAFKLGGAGTLFIVDHSEVAGPTKERARSILDLHITGIEAEH